MSTDDNPYRSPEAVGPPQIVVDNGKPITWNRHPFASGHTRAMWAIGLLAAGIVANLLGSGSTLLQINLLNRAATVGIDEDEATVNDVRQRAIGLVQMAVYLATGVAFLMWMHRAYRNLPPLGATRLNQSPGWAVGNFFVPFLNLVRPYQAMSEIWRHSYPTRSADGLVAQHGLAPGGALVGWWWASFLVMGVLGQISFRIVMDAETIDSLLVGSWFSIANDMISVPAAILAIALVRKVDANQSARHEQIVPATPATSGSPFSF